jgi:hypothetical protein
MPQCPTSVKELALDFGGGTPNSSIAASGWVRLLYLAAGCYI